MMHSFDYVKWSQKKGGREDHMASRGFWGVVYSRLLGL